MRFVDAGAGACAGSVISGKPVPVRAAIDLAGLTPEDVRVEVVMGRVDSNGHLEETEVLVLPSVEQQRLGGGFRQGYHAGTHRAAGLRPARQPQPLRRSADPALHQPAEMEFRRVTWHAKIVCFPIDGRANCPQSVVHMDL